MLRFAERLTTFA